MTDKIETIDFFNNEKNWIGFFLIEALGQKPEETMMKASYDPNSITAQLIINGTACDVTKTLEYMGSVFDEMVEKRAQEIIKDRLDNKIFEQLNEIERLSQTLKEEMQDKIEYMLRQY